LDIVLGARVLWPASKMEGVVVSLQNSRVTVRWDDGEEQMFNADAGIIQRVVFSPATQVIDVISGTTGVVIGPVENQVEPTWRVAFPGGNRNVTEGAIKIGGGDDPESRARDGEFGKAADFNLRLVAQDLQTRNKYDPLASLAHARVDLKPHQVFVLHRVASTYPHRFLLCDEVGLGKTIEAAMIIKELKARGQAKRVLIIVPPNLLRQWQFELKTKFNEKFAIFTSATIKAAEEQGDPDPWSNFDSVIVSQSWAAYSEDRRRSIAEIDWDLIIVDEAHHAREQKKNGNTTRTNLYRLVEELTSKPEFARRAVLFLTATPLQLQRHELFSLVELLRPTLFASEDDFEGHLDSLVGLNDLVSDIEEGTVEPESVQQVADYLGIDHSEAGELLLNREVAVEKLKSVHRLSEVLIRNRRSVIGGFQPRKAFRWTVTPTTAEIELHQAIEDLVSEGLEKASRSRQFALGFLMVLWQRLGASSTPALAESLTRRIDKLRGPTPSASSTPESENDIDDDVPAAEVAASLNQTDRAEISKLEELLHQIKFIDEDSKAKVLRENLKQIFESDSSEKIIIFTEFRETQNMLARLIESQGWTCNLFHGQLSPIEKEAAVESFRLGRGSQLLVSTEAGGEGRNFQFAHLLVNYDLPWNPMKIEQRIGRVDRIGQEHPIIIFNFEVKGTIEERVLDVLENRIKLFEESVGGLDPILGDTEQDIRDSLKYTRESRNQALDKVAEDTGRRVEEARDAEDRLRDLILDSKSFSAELARVALEVEESVTTEEFERFVVRIMKSHNTYVEEPDNRGEREVMFHPPFSTRHRALFGRGSEERRRILLDPRIESDSDLIEYLGFGHPILDSMVDDTLADSSFGRTAIRKVSGGPLQIYKPGWQLNYLLKVSGPEMFARVVPVFVGDDGLVDEGLAHLLIQKSRAFDYEEITNSSVPGSFDLCHDLAQQWIGEEQAKLIANAREQAASVEVTERDRIDRLAAHKKQAASDRVASVASTLQRLETSGNADQQRIVPAWKGKLATAERELELVDQERTDMLYELSERRSVTAEYSLINVARIEVSD
jgi:ATP-dependent helicase HepA